MATENIIMEMVKMGANRQECHEHIRVLSQKASQTVKEEGKENNLIELVQQETYFAPIVPKLTSILNPSSFIGRAPQQVERFLNIDVKMALEPWKEMLETEFQKVDLLV
jgi:adenylosuccinate lyase